MTLNFLKTSGFNPCRKAGRNNSGKITVRHRKGYQRHLHLKRVDLKNQFSFTSIIVLRLLCDVCKGGFISLMYYAGIGIFSFILSAQKLSIGDSLYNYKFTSRSKVNKFKLHFGDSLFLKIIPLGSSVYNVELNSLQGGSLTRAAGVVSFLTRKVRLKTGQEFASLRLPSGLSIYLSVFSSSNFGSNSNKNLRNLQGLAASFLVHKRRRPCVRGVAMNPVDHPLGGGEGKTSGGRTSVSVWGLLSKGGKTTTFKKKKKRYISKSRLQRQIDSFANIR